MNLASEFQKKDIANAITTDSKSPAYQEIGENESNDMELDSNANRGTYAGLYKGYE